MKKCPICDQGFSDEHTYCLNDGTVLQNVADEMPPTVSFSSADMETQVLRPVPGPSNAGKTDHSKWLFLLIGLMAATIAALGLAFYYSRPAEGQKQSADNENAAKNSNAVSPDQTAVSNISPGGKWAGDFSYPASSKFAGTEYSVKTDLADNGGGKVQGRLSGHGCGQMIRKKWSRPRRNFSEELLIRQRGDF